MVKVNTEKLLIYLILIIIGYFIAKMFSGMCSCGNGFSVGAALDCDTVTIKRGERGKGKQSASLYNNFLKLYNELKSKQSVPKDGQTVPLSKNVLVSYKDTNYIFTSVRTFEDPDGVLLYSDPDTDLKNWTLSIGLGSCRWDEDGDGTNRGPIESCISIYLDDGGNSGDSGYAQTIFNNPVRVNESSSDFLIKFCIDSTPAPPPPPPPPSPTIPRCNEMLEEQCSKSIFFTRPFCENCTTVYKNKLLTKCTSTDLDNYCKNLPYN